MYEAGAESSQPSQEEYNLTTYMLFQTEEAHLALWLSSSEMESATRVQILDKFFAFPFRANDFRKGTNPTFFPSAVIGK